MKAGKKGHIQSILIPYLRLLDNCKEIISFKEQRPLDNFKLVFLCNFLFTQTDPE